MKCRKRRDVIETGLQLLVRDEARRKPVDCSSGDRLPVCSGVTHPFALKLTTLAERNWPGRSVSDASAESSKLSFMKMPSRGPSLQWSSSERSDAQVGFLALAKRSRYEPPLRTTRWLG